MSIPPLLPVLAASALLALAAAGIMLLGSQVAPALAAHVAFALGILPLILAAIAYFVPVLTRGSASPWASRLPPLVGFVAGAATVAAFATSASPVVLALTAATALAATGGLGIWILMRAQRMLGARHRGLDWYLAALGFLGVALAAAGLMPMLPAWRGELRLFHLHANLLGFVGLTALGTLHVLLPTCIGQPDPGAGARLGNGIRWAVAGTVLIALGAAMTRVEPAATTGRGAQFAGALLYAVPVARLLHAWRRFGASLLAWHGAAPSLAAAAIGLLALLGHGVAHGFGWIVPRPAVFGFVIAFLIPLVSGAAAQLLPVWLRPGPQEQWHHDLRKRLCRWGGLRGLAFLLLGTAVSLAA